MSYLRGPLSRTEITALRPAWAIAGQRPGTGDGTTSSDVGAPGDPTAHRGDGIRTGAAAPTASPPNSAALAADESVVAPVVASGIEVRYLDAAAPWAEAIGARSGGYRLQAGLVARVNLLFDDHRAGVDHREEWEAVFFPLGATFDPRDARNVDYDPRDFDPAPPDGATYAFSDAPIDSASYFRSAETALKNALHAERSIEIFRNADLKAYSRVGESRAEFAARCAEIAQDGADAEASTLRARTESKLRTLQTRVRQAERRAEELDDETSARGRDEFLAGAGDVLSAFLGGRSRTRGIARSITGASRRRRMTSAAKNRLETAVDKVELLTADMQALDDELADALVAIDGRWAAKADAIETMAIGLEKSDITVDEVAIVWVPVG